MKPPTIRSSHQPWERMSRTQSVDVFQSSWTSWSSKIIAVGSVESSQRTAGSDHESRYRRQYSSKSATWSPGGTAGSRRDAMNCAVAGGSSSFVSVHGGSFGCATRQEPNAIRSPWSSATVRMQLSGQPSPRGHTCSPSRRTSYGRACAGSRPVTWTSAKWWPSISNVRSRQPQTSTSHGASVSTHTVASSDPTWRSSGPRTRRGTVTRGRRSGGSALLERRHGQAGVPELLPVQLGGLLLPAPDDGLAGVVDAVGQRVADGDGEAGDVAGQGVRDVVKGVVVVVSDDHPPLAAEAASRALDPGEFDGLAHVAEATANGAGSHRARRRPTRPHRPAPWGPSAVRAAPIRRSARTAASSPARGPAAAAATSARSPWPRAAGSGGGAPCGGRGPP